MRIFGVHDGHNASACLIEDGVITHCIQEERLTNIKNYGGFPEKSINAILKLRNLTINDIDYFALASNHSPPNMGDSISRYKQSLSIKGSIMNIGSKTPLYTIYKKKNKNERIQRLTNIGVSKENIRFVDHHLCHASAAYFGSPWWHNEKVLVLTNDGEGDGLCATIFVGDSGKLEKIAETPSGHSVGNIYSRVTFLLGFVPWEHEWKIMGMAPYAPLNGVQKSYKCFQKYLDVKDGELKFTRGTPEPTHRIYPRLRRDLEFHRFDWISGGVQQLAEELLSKWVKNAVSKTDIRKIALSGGVFMNVKANKRIMELDCLDDLFIFPSCGDESNAIGAAFAVYADICHETGQEIDIKPIKDIYYGPSFTDTDVKAVLEQKKDLNVRFVPDIDKEIASIISGGGIVARCRDRMEFGARALGNRSILADPSNSDCVRTINMMVKKRDFWMPFAPVMIKERTPEYIINPKNIASPYMMLSFDTTGKRGEFMAGVHQADLTARAQILEEEFNCGYYRVLKEYEKITGRGVLLNTSFNLHGYPVVYGPEEALWVFENSELENLALGNYLISRGEE